MHVSEWHTFSTYHRVRKGAYLQISHLPDGGTDQHANLDQTPPDCPLVCQFARVAERSLDFTHVALFALYIVDLVDEFLDFGG